MASARLIAWVEILAWVLIYGGLIAAVIGFVARREYTGAGTAMAVAGVVAVVGGLVLIAVRSRMSDPPASKDKGTP